MFLSVNKSRL